MNFAALLTGFGDDAFDDRIPAADLDFGHIVVAHAVFPHPLEAGFVRAARTQTYLQIVGRTNVTFVDQSINGITVADQMWATPPGIVVRVEVNNRDTLFAVNVRECCNVRVLQ